MVLGGGVSHGIAHVGVLKVIERFHIPIDYIAATSSGGIVGAFYAAGMEIEKIEEIALKMNWHNLVRIHLFRKEMVTISGIEDMLKKYLGDKQFSDMKIPFAVAATCLKKADLCILNEGSVAKAVAAGCAFPGAFAPAKINSFLAADGGVIGYQVPVDVARKMGANFVIASDVVPVYPVEDIPMDPLHIFERAVNILMNKLSEDQTRRANILVQPAIGEEDLWHLDEHKARRMVSAGEIAAEKVLRKLARKY